MADPAAIVITTPLSFHEARGPLRLNMEFGLMPGIYVASRENTLGTYYVSEDHPVWQRQVGSKGAMTNQGGIWVPKDTGKLSQIYIMAQSASSHEQDLDKAITQRGSALSDKDSGTNRAALNALKDQTIAKQAAPNASIAQSAAGGVIGGALVQAFIDADVGSIYFIGESKDSRFNATLQEAVNQRTPSRTGQQ